MIDESDVRDMLRRRAGVISGIPTDPPAAIQRARRRFVLTVCVTLVASGAFILGAAAGVTSLLRAAPVPADKTPLDDPFVGVWTSVDADGNAGLLQIRDPYLDGVDYKVHLYEDEAAACGGGIATGDGVGEARAEGHLTIMPVVLVCGDGTTVERGELTLIYDPATDSIVDPEGATWTRALAHARDPDPQPSRDLEAGIWPQTDVAEAREAQRLAEAGDPAYTWQIERRSGSHVDAQQVVLAFVEDQLGLNPYWYEDTDIPGRGAFGQVITKTFVLCGPGQNVAYPNVTCAPAENNRFSAIDVTVEQLAWWNSGDTVGGIWVVTGWGPSEFRQAIPPSKDELRRFLGGYLQARVDGTGAEPYLGFEPEELDLYTNGRLNLYATSDGSPYVSFDIVVDVTEPRWPSGTLYPTVRLIASDGTVVEESYLIGPGQIATGELNWVYFTAREIEAPA